MNEFAHIYYSREDLVDHILEDRQSRLSEQLCSDPERLVLLCIAHARGNQDARADISAHVETAAERIADYIIATEGVMASAADITRNAAENAADAYNDDMAVAA